MESGFHQLATRKEFNGQEVHSEQKCVVRRADSEARQN